MDGLVRHVLRKPMPAAVVAGDGPSGAAAIRSLARAGAPVVAIRHRPNARDFRSRHAFRVLAPDSPERLLDVLLELADVVGRPSPLFPLSGEALDAVVSGRERLAERYRYPFPSSDRVSAAQLRRRQLDRARALGIATPQSAEAPTDELGFPVLVKPGDIAGFRTRFRVASFRCATRGELEDAFTRAREFDPVVEEVVPPAALSSVASYLGDDGEALAVFCVRTADRRRGRVARARLEVATTGEDVEQALALLRDLALPGLAQVDFVRDRRDGEHKVAALEPGLSRWHGLAAASGIDLLRVAYWDLLGARLSAVRTGAAPPSAPAAFLGAPRAVVGRAARAVRCREREGTGSSLPRRALLVRGRRR